MICALAEAAQARADEYRNATPPMTDSSKNQVTEGAKTTKPEGRQSN
ncbi:hypothetical protein Gbro_1187 [Gordonia bronchialis DSM 43247]|uniref:Uncharacterized protein n=1 Tax=Gordonia bronchialis (strain ATCC 25592 / DSM 43247 / BCRC 13721 / JCM 3198 / KCTC 3076 / NBRC 16047 / NCTC 10667) TaxID=526226 RepID=D0L539_GORB4|nr:hypothetical protein Gbro_1187 [Gordonia bronchialis DSM 43247]